MLLQGKLSLLNHSCRLGGASPQWLREAKSYHLEKCWSRGACAASILITIVQRRKLRQEYLQTITGCHDKYL